MRPAVLTILWLLAALGAVGAGAEGVDAQAREHASRVAVGTCGACHGRTGVSQEPKYPLLAGQNANYLAAQLKAFRSHARADEDAIVYMWGTSAKLEDSTIDALAQYYSAQTAGHGRSGDAALVAHGREIYDKGIVAVGVPACGTCHGADAHGVAEFPRLAGQHAQYVLKQLGSFQNNMRNVAVMHGVAQGLKLDEMRAVAAYLEAQQ